jgi:predicted Zn-dependent protease
MKRLVIILSVLGMVFGIVAFDCSSSEMNAAKMYMADNVKNWVKAKEQLNLELAKNSLNDEAYYLLGRIDGIQGNYKSMVANYTKALSISPKFKKEIDNEKIYYWQQSFNKGIAFYNRAIKVKGDSSVSVYKRALGAFEESMTILPDTLVAYENYVYTAINMQKVDLIETPLKVLIAKGKKAENVTLLARFYIEKANKAKDAKNETEATKYFSQTIDLLNGAKAKYPNDSGLLETLAAAYASAGRALEAKESFADGVKAQPNNKVLRYNYGTILLNLKDFPGTEEQLKKAVELDPEYLDAVYNLAACYVNWAVDINEKATVAGQSSSEYKDKIKLALPLLNKYLEKKPDDAAVWEFLAKAHTLLGNQKEAEEAFKKADQFKK